MVWWERRFYCWSLLFFTVFSASVGLLPRSVLGFLGCWVAWLLDVGLLGCWVVWLGCWVVGLSFGCWVVGLLGCWVAGLLGCLVVPQGPEPPTSGTQQDSITTYQSHNHLMWPGGMREAIKFTSGPRPEMCEAERCKRDPCSRM